MSSHILARSIGGKTPCSAIGVDSDMARLHADIKPANILNVQGEFKLGDPGLACFGSGEAETCIQLLGLTETFGEGAIGDKFAMMSRG